MAEELIKVTKEDVSFRATELIFGNPVVLGIFGLMFLGAVGGVITAVYPAAASKDIIIPAITGIGALASGIAIGKLSK